MRLNVLDDLANLIFIGAHWVKDILWLRLLSIVGSLMVIPYYLLQTEPLWTPMIWSCVFISIHATRAWGIVKERRPVAFTGDEQLLYDKTFSALSFQQFKRLLVIGEWQDLERRTCSIPPAIRRIRSRRSSAASWRRAGTAACWGTPAPEISRAWPACWAASPELYDATVTQPARVMRWRIADLRELAGADESLTSALRKIAGAAIAEKLIRFFQAEC